MNSNKKKAQNNNNNNNNKNNNNNYYQKIRKMGLHCSRNKKKSFLPSSLHPFLSKKTVKTVKLWLFRKRIIKKKSWLETNKAFLNTQGKKKANTF